jgi:hypothetical protein
MHTSRKRSMDKASERKRIFAGLAGEVAFGVLPLLVVLMVLLNTEHSTRMFAAPEWSFGAAVLFGQALVKFVSGLTRGGSAATGPVAFIVSLLVVFGLAPSLFTLTMMLLAVEARIDPARWLQILQVILFCGASAMYMLLGTIGEAWNEPK